MDNELLRALSKYELSFGGPGLANPAQHDFDSYCEDCDTMVRLVFRGTGRHHCPICGRRPGALELGTRSPEDYHDLAALED